MADSLTANYGWVQPEYNASDDTWGHKLNGNWSGVDSVIAALSARLDAAEAAIEARKIPVGGLYLSQTDDDPAATLGYGEWEAVAQGRAIVGAGDNGESTWAAGEQRGAETHVLTAPQIPSHSHVIDPPETTTSWADLQGRAYGLWGHSFGEGGIAGIEVVSTVGRDTGSDGRRVVLRINASHDHLVNIDAFDSGSAGGGAAHNNVQPSIAYYIWARTA